MNRVMMMITPNSLAGQKEGEEEAGDQRKGDQTGTPTSGADAPTGLSCSECWMQGAGENMDGGMGLYSTVGAEGVSD